MGDGCVEEAASPMSHPERQRDFFHLALRVENEGQLFSSHPSELGHRTNHAMHKDVMSTIIVFRRLRQGALEFKPT